MVSWSFSKDKQKGTIIDYSQEEEKMKFIKIENHLINIDYLKKCKNIYHLLNRQENIDDETGIKTVDINYEIHLNHPNGSDIYNFTSEEELMDAFRMIERALDVREMEYPNAATAPYKPIWSCEL